jgi:hypothetical protein
MKKVSKKTQELPRCKLRGGWNIKNDDLAEMAEIAFCPWESINLNRQMFKISDNSTYHLF